VRGRKPAPTSLKILAGMRQDRVNEREPKFPLAHGARPPSWLGGYGRALWRRLLPGLVERGLVTIADIPAFEQLCDEYDWIRRVPTDAGARDRFRRWLVEFGLTPSARSRIRCTVAAPVDELQAFLDREER